MADFDLIICDEAHRTTGVTIKGEDDSAFVRVHDQSFIRADKRLYMTATPRLFDDSVKKAASEADAVLCSMDNEALFGPYPGSPFGHFSQIHQTQGQDDLYR